MKLKYRLSHLVPALFASALFLFMTSTQSWGDDKHKPSAPAKPQASHSSGGNTSHSSGGGSGRPSGNSGGRPSSSSGSSGRPSGNSSNGRPSGNNTGRPSGNSGGSNTARGGNTGHPGTSNGAQGGRTQTSGTSGHQGGGPGSGKSGPSTTKPSVTDRRTTGGDRSRPSTNRTTTPHREAQRTVSHVGNRTVARDSHNRVREISGHDSRGRDLAVHRDFRGGTRFETRGAGGRRIVGYGGGRGFTERRYIARGGHVYVQRTYVYGGRSYAYAYRSYYWHGAPYYGYAPAFYFHPGFYGWAYNPWAVPVVYGGWGWAGNPWYGYYGYYFTPYPAYASASLWLTDYLLAESLRAAYDARANANAANADAMQQDANDSTNNGGGGGGGQVALSPEVKQMIADEVKRQLDAERNAAAQPAPAANQNAPAQNANNQPEETPAALDPNQRVFVVSGNVDLVGDSGECTVTAGDVLVRSGDPNGTKVGVSVVSSKKGDCGVGTVSDVEISDLQEMHNQFRQKMDAGLKTMADNSGKNGLPKAPDTSTTAGEVPAPQPDADAGNELQSQQKDAEAAEQDVQKGSGSSGGK